MVPTSALPERKQVHGTQKVLCEVRGCTAGRCNAAGPLLIPTKMNVAPVIVNAHAQASRTVIEAKRRAWRLVILLDGEVISSYAFFRCPHTNRVRLSVVGAFCASKDDLAVVKRSWGSHPRAAVNGQKCHPRAERSPFPVPASRRRDGLSTVSDFVENAVR